MICGIRLGLYAAFRRVEGEGEEESRPLPWLMERGCEVVGDWG